MNKIHIAIDANEANVKNRVGSNVYAYQIIKQLELQTRANSNYQFSILLSNQPVLDLPKQRADWRYKIIKPTKLWTQWALPIHLFLNKKNYNVFFTPGHYAPRLCSIPYISSVMDLGFLKFPKQFKKSDLIQLKAWTKYSVKKAVEYYEKTNYVPEEEKGTYSITNKNSYYNSCLREHGMSGEVE